MDQSPATLSALGNAAKKEKALLRAVERAVVTIENNPEKLTPDQVMRLFGSRK